MSLQALLNKRAACALVSLFCLYAMVSDNPKTFPDLDGHAGELTPGPRGQLRTNNGCAYSRPSS